PTVIQSFMESLAAQIEGVTARGLQPVLICGSAIRLPLRRFLARFLRRLPVVSYEEAAQAEIQVNTLGLVSLG
ncbi:MAG: FHIPEP family type III secretion protein, partial [Deltaproteobacteria bacterium]|nr:FHIPEP family type III secretion protein [Deltaproteobacteria bacterium]